MRHVDIDRVTTMGFGLSDELVDVDGHWHAHRFHQLLYASSGVLELELADATWTLPPQRAAWIGAGTEHRVVTRRASLRTVYLDPRLTALDLSCAVFAVSDLAREMVLASMRWPAGQALDETGAAWFRALAGLAAEWAQEPGPFRLPRARTPELARALRWMRRNLADASLATTSAASGMSSRTLSRRFASETGQTFHQVLLAMRMLEAMSLLAQDVPVTEVAFTVGYRSLGSFSDAFHRFAGVRPSAW